jgi:uncharacterized membrane protein required for colicin V production
MVDIPAFNFADAIGAVILLVGILGGLKRGLSGELSRVVAIAVAVVAAWRFATPVADWAMDQFSLDRDRSYLVSFLAILLGASAVMWIIRLTLRNLMEFAFKGRIERLGGALAGLLRSSVVVAIIFLMLGFAPQPEIQRIIVEQSFFGRLAARYLRPVYDDLQQRAPQLGLPAPAIPEEPDLGEGYPPVEDAEAATPSPDAVPAE